MSQKRFSPGSVVFTPGAWEALELAGMSPFDLLRRHLAGDWGKLSHEEIEENERSLREGNRILSAYHLPTGVKVWVITAADRSNTTVLLPDEE